MSGRERSSTHSHDFQKFLDKRGNIRLVRIVHYEYLYSPIYFGISCQAANVIWRNKVLDYRKLIKSFFVPVSYEYTKRMVSSLSCLPTALYCSELVLNIVPKFVATFHLQDSVEQQFLRTTKQKEPNFHVLCVSNRAVTRSKSSFRTTFRS
jgi:hypothetical protein